MSKHSLGYAIKDYGGRIRAHLVEFSAAVHNHDFDGSSRDWENRASAVGIDGVGPTVDRASDDAVIVDCERGRKSPLPIQSEETKDGARCSGRGDCCDAVKSIPTM